LYHKGFIQSWVIVTKKYDDVDNKTIGLPRRKRHDSPKDIITKSSDVSLGYALSP